MPLYEYHCNTHGKFEKFGAITGKNDFAKCPTCKQKAEQMFSSVAPAHFVGRGFHAVEYNAPTK